MTILRVKAFLSRLTTPRTQTAAYESLNVNEQDVEPKDSMAEATRGLRRPPTQFRQTMSRIYQRLAEPDDRPTRLLGLNIVLLCISGVLFWSSLNSTDGLSLREQISMPCKSIPTSYTEQDRRGESNAHPTAPVLSSQPPQFRTNRVDGTLFPGPNPNIFRQEPSPEVDHAWHLISDTRPIPLTREDVLAIGKDPSAAVKLPHAVFGLGDDIYAGRLDVLHQLHCLNALRQESYFEYYYGHKYASPAEARNDTLHAYHLSHCVYMLLQNILCHANTDVYTHLWTDGVGHPWPDFGIEHRCVDFGAILEYQMREGVDERAFVETRAAPGDRVHRMSSFFKKVVDPERFGALGDDVEDGEYA
ncbi:oxidase ustYa family protein [Aspergillus mulundensis]|uniref:Tat pathway signal sequence n=1 Tax=Aspergillus mulundensis TaxID=1810919 RepID=A0A3D8R4Y0_9EURO|nr:hypothetical protein DSM5745_08865 [Aspergillus mulundensis]RDW69105.1 hypothetical protein DSM5745_08865 [Aspergillus mulundensis]